jgi:hypothetical protein
MILYTIMPQEQIFPAADDVYSSVIPISYKGIELMATRSAPNAYRVDRIVSTDPAHYMDDTIQPGSYIYL